MWETRQELKFLLGLWGLLWGPIGAPNKPQSRQIQACIVSKYGGVHVRVFGLVEDGSAAAA